MNLLLKSKYRYSVYTQIWGLDNSYIKYNASISFALTAESTTSIRADVLMQSENVEYTDLVSWSTDQLEKNEIALSRNLADNYHLKVGDKIYSKHIVDGTVTEYSISRLLPKAAGIRTLQSMGYTDGIIIMGYDEKYDNNISHVYVLYTDEELTALSSKITGSFEDILYRDDELVFVGKRLLPYVILYIAAALLIVACYVVIASKDISHNFKRQAMLGYETRKLNCAYNNVVLGRGASAIILVFVIVFFCSHLLGVGLVERILLVMMSCIELLSLFFLTIYSRRRLWRG
jgi:hypothetical protein